MQNNWLNGLGDSQQECVKITAEQYNAWKQILVFDRCRGFTTGKSFCEHFAVRDFLLLYNVIPEADIAAYICDTYLETQSLAN